MRCSISERKLDKKCILKVVRYREEIYEISNLYQGRSGRY